MSEASVLGVHKACTLHGKYSFTLTQKRLRSSWSAFCWCCRTPSYTYLSLHYKIFKLVYVSFYQVCAFEMAHCIFWSAFDAWGFHSTIYMVDSITHICFCCTASSVCLHLFCAMRYCILFLSISFSLSLSLSLALALSAVPFILMRSYSLTGPLCSAVYSKTYIPNIFFPIFHHNNKIGSKSFTVHSVTRSTWLAVCGSLHRVHLLLCANDLLSAYSNPLRFPSSTTKQHLIILCRSNSYLDKRNGMNVLREGEPTLMAK